MIWKLIRRLRQQDRIEKLEVRVDSLDRDRTLMQREIEKLDEKIEKLKG